MTISLRNLPPDVQKAIEETSRREGISLNKATIRLLESSLRRPAENSDFDEFLGVWSAGEAAQFGAALRRMRQTEVAAWSALQRGDGRVLAELQRSEAVGVPAVFLGELHTSFLPGSCYAEIDVFLRRKGRPIPRNDVWIAATAPEHGMHLLTLDAHFDEIPMLLREPCSVA